MSISDWASQITLYFTPWLVQAAESEREQDNVVFNLLLPVSERIFVSEIASAAFTCFCLAADFYRNVRLIRFVYFIMFWCILLYKPIYILNMFIHFLA